MKLRRCNKYMFQTVKCSKYMRKINDGNCITLLTGGRNRKRKACILLLRLLREKRERQI